MLLVFPVSSVDAHLALQTAKWMRGLGPYGRHRALIAWSSELSQQQRAPIADEFRAMDWKAPPLAFTVTVKDSEQKWPTAANVLFRECAKMVWENADLRCPWYFFEPDCTPMWAGWMDKLADAYNTDLSRPFLGAIQDTVSMMEHQRIKVGEHLVGTAVYPPNLSAYTSAHLRPSFAFDHAIAADVVPHSRSTPLIQHNWSTGNYRYVEHEGRNRIVCDKVVLRVTQIGQAIDRFVGEQTAVLHGCKDGSLIRLLENPPQIACQPVAEVVKGACDLRPDKQTSAPPVKKRNYVRRAGTYSR